VYFRNCARFPKLRGLYQIQSTIKNRLFPKCARVFGVCVDPKIQNLDFSKFEIFLIIFKSLEKRMEAIIWVAFVMYMVQLTMSFIVITKGHFTDEADVRRRWREAHRECGLLPPKYVNVVTRGTKSS
jgi:hypothetical protein